MHEELYNKCHVLSQRDDIMLEAKRVLLNEDIDVMMRSTFTDCQADIQMKISTKECRQSLPWNDNEFWKDIPNPNSNVTNKERFDESVSQIKYDSVIMLNQINNVRKKTKAFFNSTRQAKKERQILRMYFKKWHQSTIRQRESRKRKAKSAEQKEKLDTSMNSLKTLDRNQRNTNEKSHTQIEIHSSESTNSEPPTQQTLMCKLRSKSNTIYDQIRRESFKNRFKAQKSIIQEQKAKLEAQNKVIDELRLGIIKEDLLKSIDDSKVNIQEIFSRCSNKLKCVVIPSLDVVEQERIQFMLKSQKAPKVVQQMERRALERALKREIILERRRLMEETKKRLLEEAIEKKRQQDEEEKKKNLEVIKERRRKELELEKIRQKNKQIFLEKLDKSVKFHKKLLLRNYFGNLKTFYLESKTNLVKSEQHYITKMLRNVMTNWLEIIQSKYRIKYNIAHDFYRIKLLQNHMKLWKEVNVESKRSLQVAEDFYDLCLQNNTFVCWHRYACSEIIATEKKSITADNHYKRWLVFHYFYLWRSLPAVLQLEKAKEAKKKRWREKVWEVLPDYKPPDEDELYL